MRLSLSFFLLSIASTLYAECVSLQGWTHIGVPLKQKATLTSNANQLKIQANDAISIYYKTFTGAQSAKWKWSVIQSVPATSLKIKGGDDRNIAVYFIFAREVVASELLNSGITKIVSNQNIRTIGYTFGGENARGSTFNNPHLKGRGITKILRNAQIGSFSENVNFASDANQFFGEGYTLIGIAISADSDDTDSVINASISNFELN